LDKQNEFGANTGSSKPSVIDVRAKRSFKVARAAKDATSQLLFGQESKPTLDEINPRGTGRREVELEARALQQPGAFIQLIRSLIFAAIWRSYLDEFKRVKATYGMQTANTSSYHRQLATDN
jgi:hypothetical protein